MTDIRYWNKARGRIEIEKVYGDQWVRLLYETPPGLAFADSVLTRPWISRAYGVLQSATFSRRKIEPFIKAYGIDMTLYEDPGFRSFNEFFIRKFRPGARRFVDEPHLMPAPAEARYFAWPELPDQARLPVKGLLLSPPDLLGREMPEFSRGPVLLARLCPVDYHRFHFPDSGEVLDHWKIPGRLHSVNPAALRARPRALAENERHVTILQTEAFGKIAYVEVGALCVGKIVQTHQEKFFHRGQEKGYFLFGASTVVLFGEKGKWRPVEDLLAHTAQGLETLAELGTPVAEAL